MADREREDAGYLPPGVTLTMKLAAITAYNRTSGKCSPVSLMDAVAAAVAVLPKQPFDISVAMAIWEWLEGQGLVRPEIEYTAEGLATLLAQYVTISINDTDFVFRPTVMKIREILERGDWLTPGNSENVVDAVQRVCDAKRPPTEPDYDMPYRWFRAGADAVKEGYLVGYTIDTYGHAGKICVYGDKSLRDWLLVRLNEAKEGKSFAEMVSGHQADADRRVAAMLGRKPLDSAYTAPPAPVATAVNHPAHYGGEENPYEVIKVLEAWLSYDEFVGAMKFNIHKYFARAAHKGATMQDIEKGMWYSQRLVDYMKRNPQ